MYVDVWDESEWDEDVVFFLDVEEMCVILGCRNIDDLVVCKLGFDLLFVIEYCGKWGFLLLDGNVWVFFSFKLGVE